MIYHPEMLGIETPLKTFRERVGENVKSTARIALPFTVESHMTDKNNLAWRDGAEKNVYLRLRASFDDYAPQGYGEEFEIV